MAYHRYAFLAGKTENQKGNCEMKVTNVSELENNLDQILFYVENGERFRIYRRNVPIAHLIPCEKKIFKNKTVLGCGRGTVQIKSDLTEPMIPDKAAQTLIPAGEI